MFPWNPSIRKVSRRKSSRKEPSSRLILEPLESRTLLSACTVDRLTDNNPAGGGEGGNGMGDLRYCISQAADGDNIAFGVTGVINLTGPLPDLTRNLTILGPGADALTVRRSTGGEYRIFTVDTGAAVTIAGLTIADGFLTYRTSSYPKGGGIYVAAGGSLNLASSILRNNDARGDASGPPASGGGLYTDGMVTVVDSTIRDNLECCQDSEGGGATVGTGGTLVVDRSTFSGNLTAGDGGGLAARGMVTITNSTFSGNTAAKGGGAIYGYVDSLTNSTLSGNSANAGGGGVYGGVRARNTIIAGNSSVFPGPDIAGNLGSQGHNLIGNTQGGSGFDTTDLLDVDPMLGRLQGNGGPTQTMALLPGSPALNGGDPNQLGVPDQRGVVRSGGVNIGAYQASASAFLLTAPAKVTAGTPFDLAVTAVDPFGQVAVGYAGTVTFTTSDPDPAAVLPADYTFTAADAGMHTFTDTGLGETTLVTRGRQAITATDAADGSITGSAAVKVKHLRHHDGSRGVPAGLDGAAMDRFFSTLRAADFRSEVLFSNHRHAGTGSWELDLFS
jgi:predicted outer membrane repeat protein